MFLIDNHLVFWLYATTRNIDDIEVIAEFANIVKNQDYLELLYLFTYVDSMGTNEEGWNSWREGLMSQLYKNTSRYLMDGDAATFEQHLDEEAVRVKEKALAKMAGGEIDAEMIREHFGHLPKRYFRFRKMVSIVAHIETMEKFARRRGSGEPVMLWRAYEEKGYTELVVAAEDGPQLMEKLCCALASQQANILSAEIFTRDDGMVLDILRICTVRHEPVTDVRVQRRVEETFAQLLRVPGYESERYLQKKMNFLTKEQEGLPFPVRAKVLNEVHPNFTVVEIQARDRIGLLHDVFRCLGEMGLMTSSARIATEKGAALDTIYLLTGTGEKLRDREVIDELERRLNGLIV